jgi:hypothetical protein
MPYRRRRAKHRHRYAEFFDVLELTDGLCGHASFESDEERREAWFANRDHLLAEHIRHHPGKRPWAWWRFEAVDPPPYEPLAYPERSVEEELHEDFLDELKRHHNAEWKRELSLLRYLAEGGHLEQSEIEWLLDAPQQGGDHICHRVGRGFVTYQWDDAVAAGLIDEEELIDKPAERARIVREARRGVVEL